MTSKFLAFFVIALMSGGALAASPRISGVISDVNCEDGMRLFIKSSKSKTTEGVCYEQWCGAICGMDEKGQDQEIKELIGKNISADVKMEYVEGAVQNIFSNSTLNNKATKPDQIAGPAKKLINQWYVANERCRGYSDPKISEPACQLRDNISPKIEKLGYCYGRRDEGGSEMKWHKCTSRSCSSKRAC